MIGKVFHSRLPKQYRILLFPSSDSFPFFSSTAYAFLFLLRPFFPATLLLQLSYHLCYSFTCVVVSSCYVNYLSTSTSFLLLLIFNLYFTFLPSPLFFRLVNFVIVQFVPLLHSYPCFSSSCFLSFLQCCYTIFCVFLLCTFLFYFNRFCFLSAFLLLLHL